MLGRVFACMKQSILAAPKAERPLIEAPAAVADGELWA